MYHKIPSLVIDHQHFHQLNDMYDIASYIGEEVEMKGEPMP